MVACTSVAAVGLAVLVASIARTETQVAVYGTLLVLVLGGVSGSLMPRDLMPEKMKTASLATPHAWALDAYSQLLASPTPGRDVHCESLRRADRLRRGVHGCWPGGGWIWNDFEVESPACPSTEFPQCVAYPRSWL